MFKPGHFVEVVKGRKVPVGTIGIVFWVGHTKYGWSVGLRWPGGKGFVAYQNLKPAVPSPELEAQIRDAVRRARLAVSANKRKKKHGQMSLDFEGGPRR